MSFLLSLLWRAFFSPVKQGSRRAEPHYDGGILVRIGEEEIREPHYDGRVPRVAEECQSGRDMDLLLKPPLQTQLLP